MVRADQQWWVAALDVDIVGFAGVGDSRDPVRPGLGELDESQLRPGDGGPGSGGR